MNYKTLLFIITITILLTTVQVYAATYCEPPLSGDWIISSSCQMDDNQTIKYGNIIIQNNSTLEISNGTTLGLDFHNYYLQIKQDSGIMIKYGGEIIHDTPNVGDHLLTINNPLSETDAKFGAGIATTFDGNIVIGMPYNDVDEINAAGSVGIFNGTTGELIRLIDNPTPEPNDNFGSDVETTPDGKLLVSAPDGYNGLGKVHLFNGATGELLLSLENNTEVSNNGDNIAVTPDGNIVIGSVYDDTGADDAGSVYLFDGTSGELLLTINNPVPNTSGLFGSTVASTSNGDLLISTGGTDEINAVYLYNGTSGESLLTIHNPDDSMWRPSIAIPFDDNFVIGDRYNQFIYLFDGTTGDLLFTIESPDDYDSIHLGWDIAITPAGNIFATTEFLEQPNSYENGIGLAYLFNGTTGELLLTIQSPNDTIAPGRPQTAVFPNGKLVVSIPYQNTSFPPPPERFLGEVYVFEGIPYLEINTIPDNPLPNSVFAQRTIDIASFRNADRLNGGIIIYETDSVITEQNELVKIELPEKLQIVKDVTNDDDSNNNDLIQIVQSTRIPDPAVVSGIISSIIEIGDPLYKMSFDKAVQITLFGDAGNFAFYIDSANTTHLISQCAETLADSVSATVYLSENNINECYGSVGSDLIIWTTHFTGFGSSSSTLSSSSSSDPSSSSDSSSSSSSESTPPSFTTSFDEGTSAISIGTVGITPELFRTDYTMNDSVLASTGDIIPISLMLYDNLSWEQITHVELCLNKQITNNQICNSDTRILWEKSDDNNNDVVTVIDPNGIIDDATIHITEINANVATFDYAITFAKPMDTSDVEIYLWDYSRNALTFTIRNALTVMPGDVISDNIPDNIPSYDDDSFDGIIVDNNTIISCVAGKLLLYDGTCMDPEPGTFTCSSFQVMLYNESCIDAMNDDSDIIHDRQMDIIKQWAGYSENSITDSEVISLLLNISDNTNASLPNWTKEFLGEWSIQNKITVEEIQDALHYIYNLE